MILFSSKVFFDDRDQKNSKSVCPFIAYCVTEFKSFFAVSYLAIFVSDANTAK